MQLALGMRMPEQNITPPYDRPGTCIPVQRAKKPAEDLASQVAKIASTVAIAILDFLFYCIPSGVVSPSKL
jgi:hypothetical protein